MSVQQDFWGEIAPAPQRTPVAFLREQANILAVKTKGRIRPKVETLANPVTQRLIHRFLLTVPALGGYTYELFHIATHPLEIYPVALDGNLELANEEEFLAWLKERLSADETKRVVSSLLAQAA